MDRPQRLPRIINRRRVKMNIVPVYGFSKQYTIDTYGNIYSNKDKRYLKKSTHASLRVDRVRLCDKKYYDVKYLVYKSFHPQDTNILVNDDRIIFIDGNCRNNTLNNLKMINRHSREDICIAIKIKYGKNRIAPFPDYKNYYISDDGEVFSYYRSSPKKIKPYIGTDGYYQVKIPDNFGADTHIKIHRWVAILFVDNPKQNVYSVVHHKDENKLNNIYTNLEWTTLTQNTVYSTGKKCCMLDENNCILSIHDTISDLARYYRVDSSTASKQCNGKKNCFHGKLKARFFDEHTHNFIPTVFD